MGTDYGWLLCYSLCLWFAGQFHIFIMTRYFPLQEIGLYGFAYKVYGLSLMLMHAINVVLLPTFSGMTEMDVLKSSFRRVLKATSLVSVGFLISIPFMGLFVELFAGARYTGSTTMLKILIFGTATSTMFSPPVNILFALDKFKTIAMGGFILIGINLMGHLMVTRHLGGLGAASIQVLSHFLLNIYFTFNVYRALHSK